MAKPEIPYYCNMLEVPLEDRDSAWYLAIFKERWTKLQPYLIKTKTYEGQEIYLDKDGIIPENKFGVDIFSISIKRLTEVCLIGFLRAGRKLDRFEMVIAEEPKLGYNQSHGDTLSRLNLEHLDSDILVKDGVIFEDTSGRRYMILSEISGGLWETQEKLYGKSLFAPKLEEVLKRYKISAVFSALGIGTVNPCEVDPRCLGLIMVNGKLEALNKEKLAQALAEGKT